MYNAMINRNGTSFCFILQSKTENCILKQNVTRQTDQIHDHTHKDTYFAINID